MQRAFGFAVIHLLFSCLYHLKLIACAGKSRSQRRLDHRLFIAGHLDRRCCRLWIHRKTALRNQLHGSRDRNANRSVLSWSHAVVVQQQILASMKNCRCLVAIIDVQTWLRKGRRHLLKLFLLHLRIAGKVLPLAVGRLRTGKSRELVPLCYWPVCLFDPVVYESAQQVADEKEHNNGAEQTSEEDSDASSIDVRRFISRRLHIAYMRIVRSRGLMHLMIVSGHVQAPASLQREDRSH